MKATLEFDLETEEIAFMHATNATIYASKFWEIKNFLRGLRKYGGTGNLEINETNEKLFNAIDENIAKIINSKDEDI